MYLGCRVKGRSSQSRVEGKQQLDDQAGLYWSTQKEATEKHGQICGLKRRITDCCVEDNQCG